MELSELLSRHDSVEELELHDTLKEHLTERGFYTKHDVTLTEILEAHQLAPKYFANTSTGRAPIIMVGGTISGASCAFH